MNIKSIKVWFSMHFGKGANILRHGGVMWRCPKCDNNTPVYDSPGSYTECLWCGTDISPYAERNKLKREMLKTDDGNYTCERCCKSDETVKVYPVPFPVGYSGCWTVWDDAPQQYLCDECVEEII